MDFKNMKKSKKIEYILKLQSEGLSCEGISDKLGYTNPRSLTTFMGRQGYKKQNDIYVLKDDNTCPTNKGITELENQKKLDSILNNQAKILEKLNSLKNEEIKHHIQNTSNDFVVDYEKSHVVNTSIRVDWKVWETFSEICISNSKYKYLSKVDILSQLLKNFNEENK